MCRRSGFSLLRHGKSKQGGFETAAYVRYRTDRGWRTHASVTRMAGPRFDPFLWRGSLLGGQSNSAPFLFSGREAFVPRATFCAKLSPLLVSRFGCVLDA